jgi:hypothetical protein
MLPSQDDVAKFLTFAPGADEGKAFMFLEVRQPDASDRLKYQPY